MEEARLFHVDWFSCPLVDETSLLDERRRCIDGHLNIVALPFANPDVCVTRSQSVIEPSRFRDDRRRIAVNVPDHGFAVLLPHVPKPLGIYLSTGLVGGSLDVTDMFNMHVDSNTQTCLWIVVRDSPLVCCYDHHGRKAIVPAEDARPGALAGDVPKHHSPDPVLEQCHGVGASLPCSWLEFLFEKPLPDVPVRSVILAYNRLTPRVCWTLRTNSS